MTIRPIPFGCAPCAACGSPLSRRDTAGEIRVSIAAKPGASVTIAGPICQGCATNARAGTEAALDILRQAAPRLLEEPEDRQ